jgi:hypothetical protein
MEIVNLPVGQSAPPEADCVRVQELENGRFSLNASVLVSCGDVDPAESMSLIGGEPYDSYDDAESAGLAWANEHCPEKLYVSRSDGTAPLPDSTEDEAG